MADVMRSIPSRTGDAMPGLNNLRPRLRKDARLAPMKHLGLFVVALFAVPWMLDPFLPTPSGDLTSFLIWFVPAVWTPTIIAVVFLLVGGGVAALRQEIRARF